MLTLMRVTFTLMRVIFTLMLRVKLLFYNIYIHIPKQQAHAYATARIFIETTQHAACHFHCTVLRVDSTLMRVKSTRKVVFISSTQKYTIDTHCGL
jgi:hypothetical protein